MSSRKASILFLSVSLLLMSAIVVFNYRVDPLCYYRCESVEAERKNLNSYYQNLQKILLFPDTELLVLGSSRGESLPLQWLSDEYALKALNLSVGGADVHAKTAFLEFALANLKLRRVIWIADYFEFTDAGMSEKVVLTPALAHLASGDVPMNPGRHLQRLSKLLDHNTIEASFALLRGKKTSSPLTRGENSGMQIPQCETHLTELHLTSDRLAKEVNTIYDGYAHSILVPTQNAQSLAKLQRVAARLRSRGIEFTVVIPPYHPDFMRRLKTEHPDIWNRHQTWVDNLRQLRASGAAVRDFFFAEDFSQDPVRYWNDGVHFNCRAAAMMLKR